MKWIDSQQAFDLALEQLEGEAIVAVDTEADSLHSYFDKVCLIQLSTPGEDFVIDPLAQIDLSRFGKLLANPKITKVLHGGDYDLRILNRDFEFTVSNLVDSMICGQLLGYPSVGLAALLERHFGIQVNKVHQRADWSMRPLSPEMLAYAAMDTHHLIALAAILRDALSALGRWDWALEEFERLEMVRFRETQENAEVFRKLKGIGSFDRRALGVVAALHGWRDGLARKADRPPFKIIGNDVIVEIARAQPKSRDELSKIKAVSSYHAKRYGNDILGIIREVLARPESEMPERGETKPWIRDRAVETRIDRLKKVRDRFAKELGIDGAVLAPRHVLSAIATIEPRSVDDLSQVAAMREWQKKVLGPSLMEIAPPRQMTLAGTERAEE
jgi:ribonuclease D